MQEIKYVIDCLRYALSTEAIKSLMLHCDIFASRCMKHIFYSILSWFYAFDSIL